MSKTSPSNHYWWHNGVIYQIYPRSFYDTNGNGVGDLNGILLKLDYLANTLGVNAIWLSPFYPSPMKDFGYDVANYIDVDPLFGNLAAFDHLLQSAHELDIKIIIDLVPNHTSDQHPWFVESRSSIDNPKRDWYLWLDAKPDGSPPNNWISVFGGSAWEWDTKTNQYYLHSFLKEQPDLNWRNPNLKDAMFDVVRFWLERGVDGFRVDVAHFLMKDPQFRDNPVNPSKTQAIHKPLGDYDTQRHLYDKGHPDNHQIYREFRNILDEYSTISPRVAIGEIHIYDWNEWVLYYGKNLDELHMPFNFSLLNTPWNASAIRKAVDNLEAVLPPGAWPNYVLGNHDEIRLVSRIGENQARIAAMLLLTLRGTPTIYYGEEIGMASIVIPPEKQKDPAGLRQPGQERDQCRTPMQWSSAPNAGFSPPNVPGTWLPISENYQTNNVESHLKDPSSLLILYKKLLKLRRKYPTLQIGDYQPVNGAPDHCYTYTRQTKNDIFLISLNFSNQQTLVELHPSQRGKCLLSTYLDRKGEIDLNHFYLRPNEGIIIACKSNKSKGSSE